VRDVHSLNRQLMCLRAGLRRRGPTGRELRNWAALARSLAERGWPVHDALAAGWEQARPRRGGAGPGWVAAVPQGFVEPRLALWSGVARLSHGFYIRGLAEPCARPCLGCLRAPAAHPPDRRAQVYVRGEAVPEARAAAAAAFERACAGADAASPPAGAGPASAAPASPHPTLALARPPAPLALLRPATWPAPVLAADLARDALGAALALDAAPLEACFGQALAAQLAADAAGGLCNGRVQSGAAPAHLLACLPAPALSVAVGRAPGSGWADDGGATDALGAAAGACGGAAEEGAAAERWLRLGWAAVACLAERATHADAAARARWAAALAVQLQARVAAARMRETLPPSVMHAADAWSTCASRSGVQGSEGSACRMHAPRRFHGHAAAPFV